jgi:glycosyltransferase involved in cell wall biosynthesis
MKLALIVPGGVDRSGERAVIPALLALIERLARAHEVHVFALSQEPGPGRWRLAGADIHNIGGRCQAARAALAIRAEHRRGAFGLVHAIFSGWTGVAAVLAARPLGLPSAIHLTGGELISIPELAYGNQRFRRWRFLEPRVLRAVDAVTATSASVVESARRLGIAATRIPLGVATDRWPQRAPQPRDPIVPARLIHVASLNRVKDQVTLLAAIKLLRDGGTALRLDVIGEDTLGGRIQVLAGRLGIDDAVVFHGFLTQRELRPLMESAHLHVFSSRHEAGPFVLLEAAVAGVPTVGTAVGHVAEWPADAVFGVPPNDAPALAAGIHRLLGDETLRLRMAAAAQVCALREDADHTAACFQDLYLRLTSR